MSIFKRLVSRSRSNSYVDEDYDENNQGPTSPGARPGNYDPNRPPSSWKYDDPQYQDQNSEPPFERQQRSLDGQSDGKMYSTPDSQQMPYRNARTSQSGSGTGMMTGRSSRDGFVDIPSMSQQLPPSVSGTKNVQQIQHTQAPDLLTQAFNAAIAPFSEKIEGLEEQVRDLQAFVDQLEQQRLDIFAWIDKRGLRPGESSQCLLYYTQQANTSADLPPSIAKQIDSASTGSNTTAADILNQQLDRKITIVNFDLHRLQDDLNDSISSSHFASSMGKFLPDIQRLASLPSGPRYAYDLLIKLVGNLNSHGGVDREGGATDAELEEDRRARSDFGDRMDDELVEIVRRRNAEGESWDVAKEVRRFERNAAYLKNIGFETYFPKTLEVLKRAQSGGSAGSSGGQAGYAGSNSGQASGYAGSSSGQAGYGPVQSGAYGGNGGGGSVGGYNGGGNPNSIGVGGMQGQQGPSGTPPGYGSK